MAFNEIRYGIFSTALVKKDSILRAFLRLRQQYAMILFEPTCRLKYDESEAILTIQEGGEVVEEEETDEEVSCKPALEKMKPNMFKKSI
ncbi:hypothetical protein ILUMI_21449 [Ignelater luminosus]|uniref:Uncharacterized protein n=1 Tax=Ignelater luminosus TaxID=2038154 RepID=A0A8K0CCF0_IGNLU|nr:hypothetical protein ILUMI_21449 [Ignelater luminosus]